MTRNKKVFTQEEVNYILNNWGKESAHSMKKRFNCSWASVTKVATSHGLEAPKSQAWSKDDIDTLVNLSGKYHYYLVADILERSRNSVYLKARKLNIILISCRRNWTQKEEEYLKENWGYIPVEAIAKKLRRTVFSLKVKAVRMNLGSMLENNQEILTISEVSEILNISRDTIMSTWVKLGLKIRSLKLTENQSYYVIDLFDLLKFLERNQNEWDSRNVEEYALGTEPSWLREKRSRDKIENPILYRRWSEADIQNAIWLLRCGLSYEEIASKIHRTDTAVQCMLLKLGYAYRLSKFWKGKELEYLRKHFETMNYSEIAIVLGRTKKAVEAKAEQMGYLRSRVKPKGK